MEKILVATGNPHKVFEFKEILDLLNVNVELICPKDLGDDNEPVENGQSYEENSYIKAKYYYDKYHLPTLADDSGIEIDFYDGKPGIYSARFLTELNYKDKNDYIINELKGSNNRGAKFKCYVTFIKDDKVSVYEGIVEGTIAEKQAGCDGFGYDPIFIPNGFDKTNAELGQEFKNKYCHRALALQKWAKDYE